MLKMYLRNLNIQTNHLMKKIYLLLVLLLAQYSIAQNPHWEWVTGIQASYSNPDHVLSTDVQGNLYTLSTFTSDVISPNYQFYNTNPSTSDGFIVKYNADGVFQWAKQVTGAGFNNLWRIDTDPSGNLYLLGTYTNGLGIGGQQFSGSGTYVAKFNTDGAMQWIKFGSFSFPESIEVDQSGNVYFNTSTVNQFSFNNTVFTRVNLSANNEYLAKLDTNGNLIWNKTFYGPDDNAKFCSVLQLKADLEGNLLLTGVSNQATINFGDSVINNPYSGAFFLVKINASGQTQWTTSTGNNVCSNSASDILVDASNNIYLLGNYCYMVNFGSATLIAPSGSRFFISKYTPSGQNLWVKSSIPGLSSEIQSGDFDAAGNLIVAGGLYGTATFGPNVTLSSVENDGAQFVVMYDTNGIAQWGVTTGPIDSNNSIDVKTYGSNVIYTATHMPLESLAFGDITYIKEGNNFNNITLGKLVYSPLGIESFDKTTVNVYPNPVADMLYVNTTDDIISIRITDMNGRIVADNAGKKEIDFEALQSGVYMVTVTTATSVENQRVIKK
jgi:hypothetical protein